MTTLTPTAAPRSGVSFGGILKSEGIKLMSLRSTIWCYSIIVFLTIALSLIFGSTIYIEGAVSLDHDTQQGFAVQAATLSVGMSQLVIAVLGALVITGEYGTGMIRTTFTAVPSRLPALIGKALVFGVITAVVGFVSIVLSALITAPILSGAGSPVNFSDGPYWIALLGAAGYLALVGIFSFALGAIVRNSAGGIAAALGAVLVLPNILAIFASITQSVVAHNIGVFLPSNAGAQMYAYATKSIGSTDPLVLEPWVGGIVMVAWVVVLFVVASVLAKRRDV